jgi:hypothetical protein
MLRNFVLITAGLGATAVNFHKKEHMMTVPADPAQAQAVVDQATTKAGAKTTPAKKEGCSPGEDAKSVAAVADGNAAGADANAGAKAPAKGGCSPANDDKADGKAEGKPAGKAAANPADDAAAVHVAQQAHDIKTMMAKNGKYMGIGGLATLVGLVLLVLYFYYSASAYHKELKKVKAAGAGGVGTSEEKKAAYNATAWRMMTQCCPGAEIVDDSTFTADTTA